MRAIICTDYCGRLRKLIWVTENKTGISAGICERDTDPHATYHVDGTYHQKLTHRGKRITFPPEKKVPLASITAKAHLLGTAAFYAEDTMSRLPLFTPDDRADSTVILPQSVFSNIRCAAFNSYIFHRSHEMTLLSDAYSHYENGSFMLVAVHTFSLEFFSDHKVGVIVYKGRGQIKLSPSGDSSQAGDSDAGQGEPPAASARFTGACSDAAEAMRVAEAKASEERTCHSTETRSSRFW
jgi:hypothetical protein